MLLHHRSRRGASLARASSSSSLGSPRLPIETVREAYDVVVAQLPPGVRVGVYRSENIATGRAAEVSWTVEVIDAQARGVADAPTAEAAIRRALAKHLATVRPLPV